MFKFLERRRAVRQKKRQDKWVENERSKILSHSLVEELKTKGMNFILLKELNFKLKGKIVWHNADGTTTVLEEHGTIVGGVAGFETLARHYLNNAERYTNFVRKGAK